MIISLGQIIFEYIKMPANSMNHDKEWRFDDGNRFGAPPATQYLGKGQERISISGALIKDMGDYSNLQTLSDMADTGDAFALIDGVGNVIGNYTIRRISQDKSYFLPNGTPRKIDFSIDLVRAE